MNPDPLFSLRNSFWIGNFQGAIHSGSSLNLTVDTQRIERDVFVYRSYIALGTYNMVFDEVKDVASAPVELKAVYLLAEFSANPEKSEMIQKTLHSMLNDTATANNPVVRIVAASVFAQSSEYKDALKALHGSLNLEMMAMTVQVYIKMNRADFARKALLEMQKNNDDATLTQLASAWVNMAEGDFQEAALIMQEIADKFGVTTPMLANALAVARLQEGKYDQAMELLQRCVEQEQSSNPVSLINLVATLEQGGKQVHVDKCLDMLKAADPSNPWLVERNAFMDGFDAEAATYAIA